MTERDPQSIQSPHPQVPFALTGLFILAIFYTFYFARLFFLPLFLALFFNLLLSPLVRGLQKLRIPPGLGAGIVVFALFGITVSLLYVLIEPATEWVSRAPASLMHIEAKLRHLKEPVEKIKGATEEMEKLTQLGDGGAPVEIEQETLFETIFGGARNIFVGVLLILVLLYFLLASGDLFLRKLTMAMKTLDAKKRAITITRHLERDISYYLLTITLINLGVGLAVGISMYLLEMPNVLLWGVMAAILNYVPYVGAMVGIAIVTLAAAFTFVLPGDILMPPLAYLIITASEGYFITPYIIGRRLTLNPFVVLLGLIFWGWIWGIVGAILAVPLLVSFKIICEHVPGLAPIKEFLGE